MTVQDNFAFGFAKAAMECRATIDVDVRPVQRASQPRPMSKRHCQVYLPQNRKYDVGAAAAGCHLALLHGGCLQYYKSSSVMYVQELHPCNGLALNTRLLMRITSPFVGAPFVRKR